MPVKKRFIVLIAAAVLCLATAGVLAVGLWFFTATGTTDVPGMRVYRTDQVDSSHAGYRRSTMTAGDDVYINDYEEAALRLVNPDPETLFALKGNFGHSKVCAIAGQPTTAYVAGDDGSEMPAFVVYRHNGQPPFDWRSATFREMTLYAPRATNSGLKTNDPELLAEVVALLRDGKPVDLPDISMADAASMVTLDMATDQLPGMFFSPVLRNGPDGTLYVAESLMYDPSSGPAQLKANWIPVSPKLVEWLQSK